MFSTKIEEKEEKDRRKGTRCKGTDRYKRHRNTQYNIHTYRGMLPEKVGEGKGVAAVVKWLALAIIFGIQTSDAFSPLSVRAKEKERRSAAISRLEASGRSSFNPFSLVNDMFDAVKPTESLPVNSKLNAALNSIPIPDWVEIRSSLERVQTEEERAFRKNLKYGIGRGSPLHKLRLFDESNKEDDVRIVFYRDSASWCPYCQKAS